MKCLIYSDVHWCQNSSIVRRQGSKYSTRLENLIESVNWAEQLAWSQGCQCVICCGDFFDASSLNSQEISALQEIQWAPISHLFLTGNHETNVSSLEYSSCDLFRLCPNSFVINTPQQYFIDNSSVEFCFLPYVLETSRQSLQDYFGNKTRNRVVFSHNDIKNVQYGAFLSTEGFLVEDIENSCDLYFNGHIHHCCNVTSKIINVGNLTGQNFTEDATTYTHCAIVFDTETLAYKFYQNPYALKFYKIDATDCYTIDEFVNKMDQVQYNGVVTVHVNDSIASECRDYCDMLKKDHIQEYRLLIKHSQQSPDTTLSITETSVDHLKQFQSYVLETMEQTQIVHEELQKIMR